MPAPLELSGAVQLDEVDSTVRAHLERARAYVDNRQWAEAVETYRLLMDNYGGKVIAVAPRRYIRLADYCHLQLASLPAEALERYRQEVDPLAERWYPQGLAQRDRALLARIVSELYCSSWGDKALLALGDLALEEGEPSVARSYWEQIVERPPERVPEAVFEAATAPDEAARADNAGPDNADIDPADRAAVASWYVPDPLARSPGYRLRHDEPLGDETARRLTAFWKARICQAPTWLIRPVR